MVAPEPLLGRYRFVSLVRPAARRPVWLAEDGEGRSFVAAWLPRARADSLVPAAGIEVPHLATVREVIHEVDGRQVPGDIQAGDGAVAVADHVPGRSLHHRLEAGPATAHRLVSWVQVVAGALAVLHGRAGAHGAVSPRALVVASSERGVVPMLTQLLYPPSGAYCSPERVAGGGPTAADDTWALVAMLYTGLCRRPPFSGASREELARSIMAARPAPLVEAGLHDTALQALVERGLARRLDERLCDAGKLAAELAAWLAHAQEPEKASAARAPSEPPRREPAELRAELPRVDRDARAGERAVPPRAEAAPAAAASMGRGEQVVPGPPERAGAGSGARAASRWRAAALAALAAAAAAAFVHLRSREGDRPAEVAVPASGSPPAAALPPREGASEAAASPPTRDAAGDEAPLPEAGRSPSASSSACLAAAVPAGTFGEPDDLDFICTEQELWFLSRRIHARVTKRGRGEGVKQWTHLGRYDLPVILLLRDRCCPAAEPPEAALPTDRCGDLGRTLESVTVSAAEGHMDEYDHLVECLEERQVRLPSRWSLVPARMSRSYFEALLSTLARASGS